MNRKKKILAGGLVVAAAAISLSACNSSGKAANKTESQQQQVDSQNLIATQPIPGITWSQMRQNLIEIEQAQAKGVETTSFFFNQGVRDPDQVCPSIGVPIPNTASLSNPHQVVRSPVGGGYWSDGVVDQMDPNGVYAPQSSSGTYVMCVGGDGKPYANYWEGYVRTVFAPARWNDQTHKIEILGPASFTFTKK